MIKMKSRYLMYKNRLIKHRKNAKCVDVISNNKIGDVYIYHEVAYIFSKDYKYYSKMKSDDFKWLFKYGSVKPKHIYLIL